MALVGSFLIGLNMFSDMGLGPSIMQSKRGDDPAFLDTAWTIKVIRGFIIFGTACVLAWPLALFYDAPQFAWVFPAAAISMLVGGFFPTRIDSAGRHLQIGRLTLIELANQMIGILITIAAALILTREVDAAPEQQALGRRRGQAADRPEAVLAQPVGESVQT